MEFKKFKPALLFVFCLSLGLVILGCDSNPGGLSDEQKLAGAKKARDQQMGQQRTQNPTSRDQLPGSTANNGQ